MPDLQSPFGNNINTIYKSLLDGNFLPYVAVHPESANGLLPSDDLSLLSSAVRAATNQTPDQTAPMGVNGAMLYLDVTAVTGAQTLNLVIEGKDPVSGKYAPVSQSGAIGGAATLAGTYIVAAYPGFNNILSAALTALFGNAAALPRVWRARIVHSGGGNFTYSLGGHLLRA